MSLSSSRMGAALVAGALLLGSAPAFAQKSPAPAAPAAPAPAPQPGQQQGPMKVELIPTQEKWTKVCGHDQAANKDICYTTRDFGAAEGPAAGAGARRL